MEKLSNVLFYSLEKAIKTYRQFAQQRLNESGFNITIDQWLVLKTINDNPGISQKQMAEAVFKDSASLTRIIELLVQKQYLSRSAHDSDRRRFNVQLTVKAKELLSEIQPLIVKNRQTALNGLTEKQADDVLRVLTTITANCQI